ncbi:hypothetical protein CK501_05340 [Halovibrio salipaludis]|uniref:Acylphosphatase-like domain-containing protein n=1 Tax=Halovibrio salipaludis TaxID=2032626 RepID=A0A2A2F7T2_9GAMM|nr:hypothetical protein CK501_05340 [Halovibrio salipaludis]
MARKQKKQTVGKSRKPYTKASRVGRNGRIAEPSALSEARSRLRNASSAAEVTVAARQILAIDPAEPEGWRWLGEAQLSNQKLDDAVISYSRASRSDPNNETLLERYVGLTLRQGNYLDALNATRHWVTIADNKPLTAIKLLSGLYGFLGKEELSCQWGLQAALRQPVARAPSSGEERLRILVLGTVGCAPYHYEPASGQLTVSEGHNNLMHMMDTGAATLSSLSVDVIDDCPEVLDDLPDVDVVYNSITDAGRCQEGLRNASRVCRKLSAPVINAPAEVLRTTREENAQRLGQCEGILMPRSVSLGRVQGDISDRVQDAIRENGLRAPIIVRPSGYQNGKHMYRIDEPDSTPVRITDEAEVYVLQYHDVTFTDPRAKGHRFHPKYRAFMVDGKLYPAHMRMGYDGDWNVHGEETRKAFRRFPWLYDMEQDYIENPAEQFETGVWENLEQALRTLDLDYFGVDFAVCTEAENQGKVVIFETNASMRSFLRQTYQNTPENDAALEIILAAHRMFCARAGVPEWEFNPPKGLEGPAQEHGFEADPANPAARHVLFSGDLQGHGFREWLRQELHKHNLKGWLRDLSDGRVEVVVAGADAAVNHLLSDPRGPEKATIENVKAVDWKGMVPQKIRVRDTVAEPERVTAETAEA